MLGRTCNKGCRPAHTCTPWHTSHGSMCQYTRSTSTTNTRRHAIIRPGRPAQRCNVHKHSSNPWQQSTHIAAMDHTRTLNSHHSNLQPPHPFKHKRLYTGRAMLQHLPVPTAASQWQDTSFPGTLALQQSQNGTCSWCTGRACCTNLQGKSQPLAAKTSPEHSPPRITLPQPAATTTATTQ